MPVSADRGPYMRIAGTGHIRFWSMARTFTGLKLQGSIGKFGNEELSDVTGYADLPDGKVNMGVHICLHTLTPH